MSDPGRGGLKMTSSGYHSSQELPGLEDSHPLNGLSVLVQEGGAARSMTLGAPRTAVTIRGGSRRTQTTKLPSLTVGERVRVTPQRAAEAVEAPAKAHPANTDSVPRVPRLLIGVERRAFFQGCLSLWFGGFCPDFEGLVVDDLRNSASATVLSQAATMIIGIAPVSADDGWLEEQINWLRSRHPKMPILAIVDDADQAATEKLVRRFGIQGYIPASTNLEVAAAAARLIVAGGSYFPRVTEREPVLSPTPPMASTNIVVASRYPDAEDKLTPRETAVLELLSRGTPNKLIAYRLGISLSTAKVHVHNIIRKLHARNRTEVALAAQKSRHYSHQGTQAELRSAPGEAAAL